MPTKRRLGDALIEGAVTTTRPIVLPGAPTQANHAATKAYVDSQAGPSGDFVESTSVDFIVKLTQAAYDALPTKNPATLYVVVD